MLWRASLFLYYKYWWEPYFTYFRITVFTDAEPSGHLLTELEAALREEAERHAAVEGWTVSSKVKTEIEQVHEAESHGLGVNRVELSATDGSDEVPREVRQRIVEDNDRFGLPEFYGPLDEYLEGGG